MGANHEGVTSTRHDQGASSRYPLSEKNAPGDPMFGVLQISSALKLSPASKINMSKDLGTLEAGKIADIVLLGGNPLGGTPQNGFWDFLNVQVTIKGGQVLVDKRAAK